MMASLSPALTRHGVLHVVPSSDAAPLDPALAQRITTAFARNAGHGLVQLGAAEVDGVLPPAFGYFRELAQRYVTGPGKTSDSSALATAS